jgi:hypothetical protein
MKRVVFFLSCLFISLLAIAILYVFLAYLSIALVESNGASPWIMLLLIPAYLLVFSIAYITIPMLNRILR